MDQRTYAVTQQGLLVCLLGPDHRERLHAFIDGLRKDSRWTPAQIANVETSIREALDDGRDADTAASDGNFLSHREEQILRLIAKGYTGSEIAARFDLSPKTIETYKTRACTKLGLKGRPDIIRYALQHRWLDDSADAPINNKEHQCGIWATNTSAD